MSIRKTFQLFLPRQNLVLGALALALMLSTYLSFPLSEIAAHAADTPEPFQACVEVITGSFAGSQEMDTCAKWDNPIAPTEPDGGILLEPTIDTRYFGRFTIVMGW